MVAGNFVLTGSHYPQKRLFCVGNPVDHKCRKVGWLRASLFLRPDGGRQNLRFCISRCQRQRLMCGCAAPGRLGTLLSAKLTFPPFRGDVAGRQRGLTLSVTYHQQTTRRGTLPLRVKISIQQIGAPRPQCAAGTLHCGLIHASWRSAPLHAPKVCFIFRQTGKRYSPSHSEVAKRLALTTTSFS